MRVTFRPSVASDWAALRAEPLPCRIKAVTAIGDDGELLGIGGIGWRPNGTVVAFAHITDQGRKFPAAIHRAGRLAMEMISASGVACVVAEAQPDNPAAERWLLRLRFMREGDVFVWRRPDAFDR